MVSAGRLLIGWVRCCPTDLPMRLATVGFFAEQFWQFPGLNGGLLTWSRKIFSEMMGLRRVASFFDQKSRKILGVTNLGTLEFWEFPSWLARLSGCPGCFAGVLLGAGESTPLINPRAMHMPSWLIHLDYI